MLRRVPGASWGGKRTKESISIIWIGSDGSELVPTTDVEKTLPYLTIEGRTGKEHGVYRAVFFWMYREHNTNLVMKKKKYFSSSVIIFLAQ